MYDWLSGYGLGRPSSIHDEEFVVYPSPSFGTDILPQY